MKKTRITFFFALLCAAALTSCLKNEQDYFGKTASARMTEFIDNARNVLLNPAGGNGWRMEYFTSFGGYNMAVEFNSDGNATVWSERTPLSGETSCYHFTTDDGPILSFDTYNSIMHFFATPSSSYYQSRGGDFEFIIISATPQKVVLKGKRSGLTTVLYPLEQAPGDFVKERAKFANDFLLLQFSGEIRGENYTAKVDLSARSVTFAQYDADGIAVGEEFTMGYIFEGNRIKLYEPLTVNGEEFTYFEYDAAMREVTCNNSSVFTSSKIPEEYTKFDEFPGEYSFTHDGSTTVDVTLEVYDDFERVLECRGIGSYDIFLYYDANKGCLNLPAQYIHKGEETCFDERYPDLPVCLFGISSTGSGSTYYSMDIYRNGGTDAKPKYSFRTGTATAKVQSFSLYTYGDDEEGVGWYSGTQWTPTSFKPNMLIKK